MTSRPPVPLEEAVALLDEAGRAHARSRRSEPEVVPLRDALGRVLARDLAARADHPSLDDSALDGVACRSADVARAGPRTPVVLRVVGDSVAGRPHDGLVGAGEAVRIQTGAAVPEGADAVVGVERLEDEGDSVRVTAPGSRDAVRPRGQNVHRGDVGLRRGTRVTAAGLALAAAMGHAEMPVHVRPRVGILITGDELVEPGAALPPGGVFDGNGVALEALVRAAGAVPVPLPPVSDRAGALGKRVREAPDVDLLISSGGISMGRYDRVRDHLTEHGAIRFRKVLVKPGGPATFALVDGTAWLGLPGNPVSVMVTFLMLARAWIDRAHGSTEGLPIDRRLPARAAGPLEAAGAKTTLLRVRYECRDADLLAHAHGNQSSGVVRTLAHADALALVPPGARLAPGDAVETIPLAPHLG